MADAEKEKAEKLAAAKKRFEQLKKEQQKKGKKGSSKKKEDASTEEKVEDTAPTEEPAEAATQAEDVAEDATPTSPTKSRQARPPSISLQSKQRSESFRSGAPTVLSPVAGDVQELYRTQAARIEELENEKKAFEEKQGQNSAELANAQSEIEDLKERLGNIAVANGSPQEVEKLRSELSSTQRQLAQAQQAAKGTPRKTSGPSPDLTEQLESKTSTIESLELEISNLRNQINGLQTTVTEHDASATDLQERATAAETATESVRQELDALKVSIAFPSDETKAANEDPEALTKRITVLESDLRTANINLDAAAKRATSLEQKIEALTKLHKDATAASQSKDKELTDLRNQIRRQHRPSHVRDASEFELGEEETETGALQTRIRALEAENFDLKRGIWREKRAELQPGMDDSTGASPESYEEVDLNGPYTPRDHRKGSGPKQTHSSFQDVITSGISAFTGRPREATRGQMASPHGRKQSLGLLSEDGSEFDPEAFRLAQEEEGKRRIERVKEVKRGLEKWKGWRVDIVEMRQNHGSVGRDFGPVFEI